MNQITTYTLEFSPEQILPHHSSVPISAYLRSLAMHMVNAAKMCIPMKWRSPEPPSVTQWFAQIQKTAEMEELIHLARDTPSKFGKIWPCWQHYVTTDEYSQMKTCKTHKVAAGDRGKIIELWHPIPLPYHSTPRACNLPISPVLQNTFSHLLRSSPLK